MQGELAENSPKIEKLKKIEKIIKLWGFDDRSHFSAKFFS